MKLVQIARSALSRRWPLTNLLCAAAVLCGARSSPGLEIYDYSATKNNMYINTSTPSGLAPNPSPDFIGLGIDYSGVGLGEDNTFGRASVLIGSQYFLTVKHRADEFNGSNPTYQSIRIVDRNNTLHDYSVSTITPLHYTDGSGTHVSDLVLGKLTAPITDPVAFYPIYSPTVDLTNKPFQVAGLFASKNDTTAVGGAAVGLNNFDGIAPFDDGDALGAYRSQGFSYSYTLGASNEAGVVAGDSGAPSFLIYKGFPALIGLHAGNSTATGNPLANTTYDSTDVYLPYYVDEIQSLLSANGAQLTVVPEPSSGVLLLAGVAGAGLLLQRRRRRQLQVG